MGRRRLKLKSQISNLKRKLEQAARAAWWWLRQVSGDAAYENYLRSQGALPVRASECEHPIGGGASMTAGGRSSGHSERKSPKRRQMNRVEFYLDSLQRRYSGVSRCC
jgi:uncharacterized short protein YbdD (DUF466 family)